MKNILSSSALLVFSIIALQAKNSSDGIKDTYAPPPDSLAHRITYTAQDSTRFNKNKSIITLYGNARFNCNNFQLSADEITINKTTQKVKAKNYTLLIPANYIIKTGNYAEFSMRD